MHPLENQLENQSIPFQKSLLFLKKKPKQNRRNRKKTNLVHAHYCIQAPKAFPKLYVQFRPLPTIPIALTLPVNVFDHKRRITSAGLENISLQLRLMCSVVTSPHCRPKSSLTLMFLSFPSHEISTMWGVHPS